MRRGRHDLADAMAKRYPFSLSAASADLLLAAYAEFA